MNENIDENIFRHLNEEHQDLRLRLSRVPYRSAPPALLHALREKFAPTPTDSHWQRWFAWPVLWKPVGALALGALLAGAWIARWKVSEAELIDMEPLAAAHSRYQAETLVPAADMAGSNFGGQLAVYYGDED